MMQKYEYGKNIHIKPMSYLLNKYYVFQYGPSSESLDFHSNTTTAQKVDPLRHPHVPESQSPRTGTHVLLNTHEK